MKSKGELAREYFLQGYNCAQAVGMAFSEEMNLEADTVAKMVSAFGGGMGRMREVCGAVSGMFFVLSVLEGYSDPKDHAGKMALALRLMITVILHKFNKRLVYFLAIYCNKPWFIA